MLKNLLTAHANCIGYDERITKRGLVPLRMVNKLKACPIFINIFLHYPLKLFCRQNFPYNRYPLLALNHKQ